MWTSSCAEGEIQGAASSSALCKKSTIMIDKDIVIISVIMVIGCSFLEDPRKNSTDSDLPGISRPVICSTCFECNNHTFIHSYNTFIPSYIHALLQDFDQALAGGVVCLIFSFHVSKSIKNNPWYHNNLNRIQSENNWTTGEESRSLHTWSNQPTLDQLKNKMSS